MATDANTIRNTIKDANTVEARPVHVHQPPPPPPVEMSYRVINSSVLPGAGQSQFGHSPVNFSTGTAVDHSHGRSAGVAKGGAVVGANFGLDPATMPFVNFRFADDPRPGAGDPAKPNPLPASPVFLPRLAFRFLL